MYKAYCPKCKYQLYTLKRASGKNRVKFNCSCGCNFVLDISFTEKVG